MKTTNVTLKLSQEGKSFEKSIEFDENQELSVIVGTLVARLFQKLELYKTMKKSAPINVGRRAKIELIVGKDSVLGKSIETDLLTFRTGGAYAENEAVFAKKLWTLAKFAVSPDVVRNAADYIPVCAPIPEPSEN